MRKKKSASRQRGSSDAKGPRDASRRRFLRRAALGAGVVAGGGAIWSLGVERRGARVYRVEVRLPDLPRHLEGFTICQLSDFHCGPLVSGKQIERGVALAMSLKADLIALTGDYVWQGAGHAEECGRALRPLRAPHGVYGVLGNHDYWSGDVARVSRAVTEAGVQMLVNESVQMGEGEDAWWLCGVDDVWSGDPKLAAASAGAPKTAFKILLCHEPDFADSAAKAGFSLQLSGHSHGGQVRLPGVGALILPYLGHKYPIGLQEVKGSQMRVYTNVGLGVVFPPVRFNCWPEVTQLTLRRA